MKQVQINGREVLLAKTPKGEYHNLSIREGFIYFELFDNDPPYSQEFYEILPPGSWRILGSGKASEITEEEWREVVEDVGHVQWTGEPLYQKYTEGGFYLKTATESGHSFLSHHGYEPSQTIILVKQ